jgi:hypothetical protein
MAELEQVARAGAGWRTRAGLVLVVVAAAGTLAGVAGATPTTSTTDVSFVSLTVPHKVLSNTSVAANAVTSPVVIGGSTTVPTNATTVRLVVSAKGAKGGTLSFFPTDNPAGASGQTLTYPAGSAVATATIEENVGLSDKLSVRNTGAGSAAVTATITGYSTQVTAGDVNGTGGTAGQVLTDDGAGGASWTDVGRAYHTYPGYFVQFLPQNMPTTLASLTVPPGTYAVSVSGIFQVFGGGVASATCQLKAPNGTAVHVTFVIADSTTVSDSTISEQGVLTTSGGGVITEVCTGNTPNATAGDVGMTALRVGSATGAFVSSSRLAAPATGGSGVPVRH